MMFTTPTNNILGEVLGIGTELYGVDCFVYLPRSLATIKSDYDRITYEVEPDFKIKVVIPSLFHNRRGNASSLFYPMTEESNIAISKEKLVIGTLIAVRDKIGVFNYKVDNITNVMDDDVVYYYRYDLVPFTLEDYLHCRAKLLDIIDKDKQTNLPDRSLENSSSDKLIDNKNLTEIISRNDDSTGRKLFVNKIKEVFYD